jgi:ABC-type phosphate transport system substrate-binding protein
MISSNKSITIAIMLAAIAAVGISGVATQTTFADDKRVRIDLNIKVQNQKGDKGDPGQDSTVPGPTGPAGADSTVPGPIGPAGPAGADGTTGNVTVNVCQVGTSNCVSENIGPNSTLTIFVNATGGVVEGNTTVPVPEPVVCQPGTHNENDVCVDDVVIPPVNTTTTNTTTTENTTSTETNSTG